MAPAQFFPRRQGVAVLQIHEAGPRSLEQPGPVRERAAFAGAEFPVRAAPRNANHFLCAPLPQPRRVRARARRVGFQVTGMPGKRPERSTQPAPEVAQRALEIEGRGIDCRRVSPRYRSDVGKGPLHQGHQAAVEFRGDPQPGLGQFTQHLRIDDLVPYALLSPREQPLARSLLAGPGREGEAFRRGIFPAPPPLVLRPALGKSPLHEEYAGEPDARRRKIRVEFHCPAIVLDRSCRVPAALVREAQVVVRLGVPRLGFQRPPVRRAGLVELAQLHQGAAQIAPGARQQRLDREGTLAGARGGRMLALPAQRGCQIVPGGGKAGGEFGCAPACRHGFGNLP